MDMTTHSLTAGLTAASRHLVGELLDYTRHLNSIGNGANNVRLQVEPEHTPDGEGFTLRQRPGPLGHLLEFIHVAHADDHLGSLSFTAQAAGTAGAEGTLFTLTERPPQGGAPVIREWRETDSLETIRDHVEDAVFSWILAASHPAAGHQPPDAAPRLP